MNPNRRFMRTYRIFRDFGVSRPWSAYRALRKLITGKSGIQRLSQSAHKVSP